MTDVAFVTTALLAAAFSSNVGLPGRLFVNQLPAVGGGIVAAYETGVQDEALLSLAYAPPGEISRLAWLEHERLGPWVSNGLDHVAEERRVRTAGLPKCLGNVESEQPVSGGKRYNGWAALSSGRRPFSYFQIVGPRGDRRGFGYIGVFRPDVRQAGASTFEDPGFMAFVAGSLKPGSRFVLFDAGGYRPACVMPLTSTSAS